MTRGNGIRRAGFAIAVALAALFPLQPARAGAVYVAGSANDFGTLDLSTGAFTEIGTLNLPGGDRIYGMGFGADGNLYGVDSQLSSHLIRINPANASVTDLGSVAQSAIGSTTDASGKMYVLSQDGNAVFYTLHPPATATNVIGSSGIMAGGLVAVNAAGTQLFASQDNTDKIYSVNLSTGVATPIGDAGFVLDAGLFVDGTLYGFDVSRADAIVAVNTTTGAGTQVASYSLPDGDVVYAAAVAMVPEPASVTLCVIGGATASVGLLRRRRGEVRGQKSEVRASTSDF